MTREKIQRVLKTMVLIVDTREHVTDGFRERVVDAGLPYTRRKLEFGDYACQIAIDDKVVSFENCVAVERKMSLAELARCFVNSKDHEGRRRFEDEFKRAKEKGAKVYLLIENGSVDKILSHSYRSQMSPTALLASLFAFLARYRCQVVFCKPENTGRLIREIMVREVTERLVDYD